MSVKKQLSKVRELALDKIGSSKSLYELTESVISIGLAVDEKGVFDPDCLNIPVYCSDEALVLGKGLFPFRHTEKGIFLPDLRSFLEHHKYHAISISVIETAIVLDEMHNKGNSISRAKKIASDFLFELRKIVGANCSASMILNDFSFINENHGKKTLFSSTVMDIVSSSMKCDNSLNFRLRVWGSLSPVYQGKVAIPSKGYKPEKLDIPPSRMKFNLHGFQTHESTTFFDVNRYDLRKILQEIFEQPQCFVSRDPEKLHEAFELSNGLKGAIVTSYRKVNNLPTYELLVVEN